METNNNNTPTPKSENPLVSIVKLLSRTTLTIIGIVFVLVIGGVMALRYMNKENTLTIETNKAIDITPQQIQSIQEIGQWEFLSISDEEMVDTMRNSFLKDGHLTRIYYGTLRIGIDLHQAKPKWLRVENDTIVVATLPKIQLLDRNFIDEARTTSFYEVGEWTAQDREALYNRAYRKMMARCVTPQNIATAQQTAKEQFTKMFQAMGYRNVRVEFEK